MGKPKNNQRRCTGFCCCCVSLPLNKANQTHDHQTPLTVPQTRRALSRRSYCRGEASVHVMLLLVSAARTRCWSRRQAHERGSLRPRRGCRSHEHFLSAHHRSPSSSTQHTAHGTQTGVVERSGQGKAVITPHVRVAPTNPTRMSELPRGAPLSSCWCTKRTPVASTGIDRRCFLWLRVSKVSGGAKAALFFLRFFRDRRALAAGGRHRKPGDTDKESEDTSAV